MALITIVALTSFTCLSQSSSEEVYRLVAYNVEDNSVMSVSNTVQVEATLDLFIPSAFSPDYDNINDQFTIKGKGIDVFEMRIYNRWGELVFETRDINNFWDGNYRGEMVQQGVYTYEVFAQNTVAYETKSMTGNVTVIR